MYMSSFIKSCNTKKLAQKEIVDSSKVSNYYYNNIGKRML